MAAKKNTSKPAPKKSPAKPAVKPAKPAAAAKKPAAKKPAEKSAKKPAAKPVKAAAPSKAKKPATGKVSAPLKKAAAPKAEKAPQPPVKSTPPVVEAKPAPQPKVSAPAKKVAATKPRSSVVDFPAPPAPVKPPFVPPKAATAFTGETVAPGSNGTHSPAFVQKQRQRLLDLRDDLVDAVSGMARDTIRNAPEGSEASGSGQHQGDAGSDAYDRDFALSVLAKEQDALYEIEQALRRIQSGSYGICEMSSRKIPQARLEAIPFARLTVECQAQWEKEYGNRRFRPSNEVGFSGGKYAEDEDSEAVSLDEDDD
jgi:RNA polymerase-binding transcription factor DksA